MLSKCGAPPLLLSTVCVCMHSIVDLFVVCICICMCVYVSSCCIAVLKLIRRASRTANQDSSRGA